MTPPARKERPRLAPGTVLDERFEIAEFLGAGSFGEVYRAKQLIFGQAFREVALKLFAEGVVTALNARETLNDAIIIVGLLEEQHSEEIGERLVQVYDMGMVRTPVSRAFMSMKLIPGRRTLKSEVYRHRAAGGMPVSLSLRYLRELLLPLAWMHGLETAVVHGDLKPDNVMITEDARLVLVDFGLAAHMPLGVRGGDIAYLAPEKLLGLSGGQESDIYSVGVIWYELLTGVHPFAGIGLDAQAKGDSNGFLEAHLAARKWPIALLDKNLPASQQPKRIVPASEINHELAEQHPQIELLLNKCLADDISQRHANARVLLDKIETYLASGRLAKSDLEVIGAEPKAKPATVGGISPETEKTDEMRLADATALWQQGKTEPALAVIENILKTSPQLLPALLLQSKILLGQSGRLAVAATVCDRMLALAPNSPEVYEALAALRLAQNKPTQAAGYRSRAEELRRTVRRKGGVA